MWPVVLWGLLRGVRLPGEVLRCSVPLMMLLMMHQASLHQPWRLDEYNPFVHPSGVSIVSVL